MACNGIKPVSVEDQATLPAEGTAPATPEADAQVESEASIDAADTTESGDDSTTDSKDDAKAEADKAQRKTQRRIDRLIAEKSAAQQRVRDLEAAAEARARAAEEDDEGKPKPEDPREIAKVIRLVEKTAEATAKVMKEAKARFPDFEQAIAELVEEIGPQIDQVGRPSPLMDAVLDSDKSAELLHYLGKNTEVAAELVGLSPARLGRRIAAIESELKAKAAPKPSGAAKPLAPVKPSAPAVVDPSKLTDKQWAEQRRKERMSA